MNPLLNRRNSKKSVGIVIAILALVSFSTNSRRLRKIANDFLPRELSLYLGNGNCLWQPPLYDYDVPKNINFTKTLVAGYPSGDKHLTFVQMEALTGLSARDEWDFAFLVSFTYPNYFIFTPYLQNLGLPHICCNCRLFGVNDVLLVIFFWENDSKNRIMGSRISANIYLPLSQPPLNLIGYDKSTFYKGQLPTSWRYLGLARRSWPGRLCFHSFSLLSNVP